MIPASVLLTDFSAGESIFPSCPLTWFLVVVHVINDLLYIRKMWPWHWQSGSNRAYHWMSGTFTFHAVFVLSVSELQPYMVSDASYRIFVRLISISHSRLRIKNSLCEVNAPFLKPFQTPRKQLTNVFFPFPRILLSSRILFQEQREVLQFGWFR